MFLQYLAQNETHEKTFMRDKIKRLNTNWMMIADKILHQFIWNCGFQRLVGCFVKQMLRETENCIIFCYRLVGFTIIEILLIFKCPSGFAVFAKMSFSINHKTLCFVCLPMIGMNPKTLYVIDCEIIYEKTNPCC